MSNLQLFHAKNAHLSETCGFFYTTVGGPEDGFLLCTERDHL